MTQTNQTQLFETEDQYGNDIIERPKINKRKLTTKEAAEFKTKQKEIQDAIIDGINCFNGR